jgi:quercetin dioxygenase-like cupin family protein
MREAGPDDNEGGTMTGIVRAAGDGMVLRNPVGGTVSLMVRGSDTGGSVTALETTAAPGEGPPLHCHANEGELLYVIDGTFRFRLEDEVSEASAGGIVFIPRGVRHTWQNVADAPARMLAVFTPSGMEQFFERFSEHADRDSAPEAFRRIGADVGMDVVGPPLAQSHPGPEPTG